MLMLRTSPRKRQEERRLLNEYAILLHKKSSFSISNHTQIAAGFEFQSMSQLLSPQKIDSLDTHQQYCIDISSTIGFVKANDSQITEF